MTKEERQAIQDLTWAIMKAGSSVSYDGVPMTRGKNLVDLMDQSPEWGPEDAAQIIERLKSILDAIDSCQNLGGKNNPICKCRVWFKPGDPFVYQKWGAS